MIPRASATSASNAMAERENTVFFIWQYLYDSQRAGSKHVNNIDGGFRDAEIVVGDVAFKLAAASGAAETVVAGIGPAYSDLGLQVPMARKSPVIAIGDAGSAKPSLVARILKLSEVCAKKR